MNTRIHQEKMLTQADFVILLDIPLVMSRDT